MLKGLTAGVFWGEALRRAGVNHENVPEFFTVALCALIFSGGWIGDGKEKTLCYIGMSSDFDPFSPSCEGL